MVKRAQIPILPERPEDILNAFDHEFTDRTKLVLCSHITTGTGLITPIKALARLAHDRGALIVADGAHAPGMIPLDLLDLGLRLLRRQLSQMAVCAHYRRWNSLRFGVWDTEQLGSRLT